MEFFAWLENSAFSMWVKDVDTLLGYDLYLVSHAIGMAALVGLSSAVALRVLGFAARVPLAPMERFFPLMVAGFWLNALSGLVLFVVYPLNPVRNPTFYVKIGLIVAAVVCLRRLRRVVFGNPAYGGTGPLPLNARVLAGTLLLIWIGVITAGRLMAYHGTADVERQVSLAMALIMVAMLLAGYAAARLRGRDTTAQVDA